MTKFFKPTWHERNHKFLKGCPCYQRGQFVGSYLEIIDRYFEESPPIYKDLKGPQLIGVNNDPEVIFELTKKKLGRTLICGDAFDVAHDLVRDPKRPPVAAYVMDTQNMAAYDKFWGPENVYEKLLLNIVRKSCQKYVDKNKVSLGCGLILNFVLDGRGVTLSSDSKARAERHADYLQTFFGTLVGPKVPSFRGPDTELLDDHSWVGNWGPHEVYKSSSLRMITTRVWVRGSTITLEK